MYILKRLCTCLLLLLFLTKKKKTNAYFYTLHIYANCIYLNDVTWQTHPNISNKYKYIYIHLIISTTHYLLLENREEKMQQKSEFDNKEKERQKGRKLVSGVLIL